MPAAKRMGKESMPTILTLIALLERAKSADFTSGIKTQPKKKTDRINMPRLGDKIKQGFKKAVEQAPTR